VVWEGAEVAVAPAVVGVGAGPPGVAGRLVEVVDREGAEVPVDVDWVVTVTEEAGAGRVPADPEPPAPFELPSLPAGGGRTSR
jgi:hypothetical protein